MSKVSPGSAGPSLDNISASPYISHMGECWSEDLLSVQYLGERGVLFKADCLDLLASIRSESVDVVFADPPFNLGKQYEEASVNDNLHAEMYKGWCKTWILESIRVLKPGGALFLYHMPSWLMEMGAYLNTVTGVVFRNWIAMKMKNGFPIRNRLHPAHYGMLYYTKEGGPVTFNVVRTKAPVCRNKKCKTLQRDYGGYRKKYARFEDETGVPWIQISDFWEDTRPATHDKQRVQQINELPLHVPERAIQMSSVEGDIVLDVFSGSGSTIHAAQRNGRHWIAGDKNAPEAALRRIASFWGTDEEPAFPERLDSCFTREIREAVVKTRSSHRPIMDVVWKKESDLVPKFAPKSKVMAS